MAEAIKKITSLYPDNQVSEQKEPEKPWLRQKNEPANWYLRFKRWLELGPKRTLQAAIDAEPRVKSEKRQTRQNISKNLHKVSIPGSWSRAVKVWKWRERAEAYDLAQEERQAGITRKLAISTPYASRAYRILCLNQYAVALNKQLNECVEPNVRISIIARLQSIMRDIASEMTHFESMSTKTDAEALKTLIEQGCFNQLL